ncbi:MAG TPA: glycosyltransferase family 39 protein, partial [Polyangia bacterium]|nr:glycosyltransferase family 39 protein [Polyangia bacterium]
MIEVLYPLVFFALIGGGVIAWCGAAVPPAERPFLTRVLGAALVLRLICATIFATFPETRLFHEDASGYEYFGMLTARGWSGTGPPFDIIGRTSPNFGFYWLSAAIYYVLGQFAPLVAYFNCVLGAGTVFLVYRLARQFFHPLVAKRAALLAAFVPSMILWSSTAGKDTLMSLLILLGLTSCVAVKRRITFGGILGIMASLLLMQPVRFYMVYFLGFAILTSLFLERGAGLVTGIYKQVVVGGILVGLLVMVGFSGRAQNGLEAISFARVSSFRHGMAITASSGFDND